MTMVLFSMFLVDCHALPMKHVTVYAYINHPNAENRATLQQIRHRARTKQKILTRMIYDWIIQAKTNNAHCILMGDLNGTYNKELETQIEMPTGIKNHSCTAKMGDWLLKNTIDNHLLLDTWRLEHPHDPGFTKIQTLCNKNVSRSRLDYILTSPTLAPWITVNVDPEHTGIEQLELDHHPIYMTLLNIDLLPATINNQLKLTFWLWKRADHKAAKMEH